MIIAIANQKGGVGKTTTAINLAAAFAHKGFRTLLIDLDPQTNATLSFIDPHEAEHTMFDVLVNACPLADAIQPTQVAGLDVAPARISLAKVESNLVGELDAHFHLKDRIAGVDGEYDYVVIDTPPTLGLLTVNALVAASHLLVPIQASYFALEGTDDLLETFDKIKARANPDLQLLGVLVTLLDRRTLIARDSREEVAKVFGTKVFQTVISRSVRLEESPAYRSSIFEHAPNSSGATEYYALCEEVLSRV